MTKTQKQKSPKDLDISQSAMAAKISIAKKATPTNKAKVAQKKHTVALWVSLGLFATLLSAPNATLTKYSLGSLDPLTFTLIRMGAIVLISLPILFMVRNKLNKHNLKLASIAGLFMAIAIFCFIWAVDNGVASYVIILELLSPIILVILSAKITNEKIRHRAMAGITLAALGGFIIVFGPIVATSGANNSEFFGVTTALMLMNVVAFPLGIIYSKKATAEGVPLYAITGITSVITFTIAAIWYLIFPPNITADIDSGAILAAIYTGIGVIFLARMINIGTYKHLGSATLSAFFYLEVFVALIFAALVLGDKLSLASFVGGVVILLGIYLTESRNNHKKHIHIFRHH